MDLSDNPLQKLDVDWELLPNLKEIYAHNCQLNSKSFETAFFQKKSFRTLSFVNNKFESIDSLLKIPNVVYLYVKHNKIGDVDLNLVNDHKSLKHIDLSQNPCKLDLSKVNQKIKVIV